MGRRGSRRTGDGHPAVEIASQRRFLIASDRSSRRRRNHRLGHDVLFARRARQPDRRRHRLEPLRRFRRNLRLGSSSRAHCLHGRAAPSTPRAAGSSWRSAPARQRRGTSAFALASTEAAYLAAWTLIGAAMRLTLYDAAFAALVQVAPQGRGRRAISYLTLFGGFASSLFWPIGHALAGLVGWRMALGIYAGLDLAVCLPLILLALAPGATNNLPMSIPRRRPPPASSRRRRTAASKVAPAAGHCCCSARRCRSTLSFGGP